MKIPVFGLAVIAGALFWGWDALKHDHDGAHGLPLPVTLVQSEITEGAFTSDDGSSLTADTATCQGSGDEEAGGFTHFECWLTFKGGGSDEVVVHNLPDGLMFSSNGSD